MKSIKFLDYIIKMSGDGIVLVKDGCNAMPGACQFGKTETEHAINEAKKSALLLFMIARPKEFDGALYWRLTRRSGAYHEWFTLKNVLKEEGIEMPPELKEPAGDINFMIGFNSKQI